MHPNDSSHIHKSAKIKIPAAILLDLDDTILNYTSVGEETWIMVCQKFAGKLDNIDAETLHDAITKASNAFWDDPVKHRQGRLNLKIARREPINTALKQLGIDSPALAAEIGDTFHIARENAVKLFPKSIHTLKQLKQSGISLALLTNGSSELQRSKIDRFHLSSLFDHILIEGEVGYGKPDSQIFTQGLDLLNVNADDVWMVGDDLHRDISGAIHLGIFTIWVDWKGDGLPSNSAILPDKIIGTISELTDLIKYHRKPQQ
jgi:putative hydrolase of the HAD superfamily